MTTDNTTVPSLPLQLQNPNLFSTNKVGVQVNNYLITDEALMADPFLLEANKSLRPDNKGFLAVKLKANLSNLIHRALRLRYVILIFLYESLKNINFLF